VAFFVSQNSAQQAQSVVTIILRAA